MPTMPWRAAYLWPGRGGGGTIRAAFSFLAVLEHWPSSSDTTPPHLPLPSAPPPSPLDAPGDPHRRPFLNSSFRSGSTRNCCNMAKSKKEVSSSEEVSRPGTRISVYTVVFFTELPEFRAFARLTCDAGTPSGVHRCHKQAANSRNMLGKMLQDALPSLCFI